MELSLQGLHRLQVSRSLLTHLTMSREVQTIAHKDDGRYIAWIANLTRDSRSVEISGLHYLAAEIATLAVESFDHYTQNHNGFE